VATVISVIALVVALAAFTHDSTATASATSQPTGTATGAPEPAETAGPTDGPTDGTTDGTAQDPAADTTPADPLATDAPLPSGGAPYTVVKQDVRLTLTGSTAERYIDLDQPLVNAEDTRSDVRFSVDLRKPTLNFDSVKIAQASGPTVTPDECASDIQLSPTDQEVELSQDLVLCTVTNGIGAANEPSRLKMARIVVNSIKDDGGTSLTITTWEIPH
jgi:hypothetical protein